MNCPCLTAPLLASQYWQRGVPLPATGVSRFLKSNMSKWLSGSGCSKNKTPSFLAADSHYIAKPNKALHPKHFHIGRESAWWSRNAPCLSWIFSSKKHATHTTKHKSVTPCPHRVVAVQHSAKNGKFSIICTVLLLLHYVWTTSLAIAVSIFHTALRRRNVWSCGLCVDGGVRENLQNSRLLLGNQNYKRKTKFKNNPPPPFGRCASRDLWCPRRGFRIWLGRGQKHWPLALQHFSATQRHKVDAVNKSGIYAKNSGAMYIATQT